MSSFVTKVLGEKKAWRSMEARSDALPRDCRFRYGEMMPTGEDGAAFCGERLRDTPYTDARQR
jgi:DNA-binding ferritin-like protein (Dps family)